MLRFLLTRIGLLIPTFIGVSIVAFAFIRLLPGDPIILMAGERGMSQERYAEMQHLYGYDQPVVVQYFDYLWGILHGDLGQSIVTKRGVAEDFFTLFPATVELSLCAIIFAVALGIPAGVFAAVRRGTVVDQAIMSTALVGYSMPIFWWGLLLIILFSGVLGWTPVSGRISLLYYFPQVTGFMLIDSLVSGQKGAFGSAVENPSCRSTSSSGAKRSFAATCAAGSGAGAVSATVSGAGGAGGANRASADSANSSATSSSAAGGASA